MSGLERFNGRVSLMRNKIPKKSLALARGGSQAEHGSMAQEQVVLHVQWGPGWSSGSFIIVRDRCTFSIVQQSLLRELSPKHQVSSTCDALDRPSLLSLAAGLPRHQEAVESQSSGLASVLVGSGVDGWQMHLDAMRGDGCRAGAGYQADTGISNRYQWLEVAQLWRGRRVSTCGTSSNPGARQVSPGTWTVTCRSCPAPNTAHEAGCKPTRNQAAEWE